MWEGLSKLTNAMKNRILVDLVQILSPLMLDIQKSSARRRFLRHIGGFNEDYDKEAQEIRKEFGDKNPDGSFKIISNLIQYTPENRKKADEKFKTLNDLDIQIDWTSEEEDKKTVIEILNGLIEEAKKATEFNDQSYAQLELLQEITAELAK